MKITRVSNKFLAETSLERFLHERRERQMYREYETLRECERLGLKPIMGASGVGYDVCTATVFAMTTGAKTALMAISPSGHGIQGVEMGISFDGVTASAVPAFCEAVLSTQAGAGTSGVTPTITQSRGRSTGGSAPTGGSNYTGEPTTITRLKPFYLAQFMGTYVLQWPLGREAPEIDNSSGTNRGLGIRINVTANVNFSGWLEVEANG